MQNYWSVSSKAKFIQVVELQTIFMGGYHKFKKSYQLWLFSTSCLEKWTLPKGQRAAEAFQRVKDVLSSPLTMILPCSEFFANKYKQSSSFYFIFFLLKYPNYLLLCKFFLNIKSYKRKEKKVKVFLSYIWRHSKVFIHK